MVETPMHVVGEFTITVGLAFTVTVVLDELLQGGAATLMLTVYTPLLAGVALVIVGF